MTGVGKKAQSRVAATSGLYIPRGVFIELESVGGEEFEVITVYQPRGTCSNATCCDGEFLSIFIGLFGNIKASGMV